MFEDHDNLDFVDSSTSDYNHTLPPQNQGSFNNAEPIISQTSKEMFTARPQNIRPLMWRNYLEPQRETCTSTDFTKTPLPTVSARLMSNQREGLEMHRLETALRNPTSPEFSAALKSLTIRTWESTFTASQYPSVMERLLVSYSTLRNTSSKLRITNSEFFNTPHDNADTQLSQLTKIATIFRNMSMSNTNLSLVSIHPKIIEAIADMLCLSPFLPNSTSTPFLTLNQYLNQYSHYSQINQEENNSLLSTMTNNSSVLTSILTHNKCDTSINHMADMQFSSLVAMCNIIKLVKLRRSSTSDSNHETKTETEGEYSNFWSLYPKLLDVSYIGQQIFRCLPVLIEIATSSHDKTSAVFLAIETLGKLATNPNSRPLWHSLPQEQTTLLFLKMIEFALVDDELSDWSIFLAYHLAAQAINLLIAQVIITKHSEVVENLILLISSYKNFSIYSNKDITNAVAHRRYDTAVKAANILAKLSSIIPLQSLLLPYAEVIAELHLSAPTEISSPICPIILDLQSTLE